MKKIGLIMASAMIIGSVAHGAAISWTGPAGGNIEDGVNWSSGSVPATGTDIGTVTDTAVQFTAQQPTPTSIIFAGTSSLKNNQNVAVRISNSVWTFNDSSSFNLLGAAGAIEIMVWGRGVDGNSYMTWNSTGTLSGVNDLRLGNTTAQRGFITQNAGTFTVADSLQMKYGSVFTMAGGTLSANNLIIDNASGDDILDFLTTGSGGAMSFANGGADYTATLEGFITAGDIRIDGAAATVSDFNISYSGTETTITVIPEPATIGLVMAFGGGILFIRRKLMM